MAHARTNRTEVMTMWWLCGAIVAAVAAGGLLAWCCGAVAGRCDDELEVARQREAAMHERDVEWWSLMDEAALDAAREGDCNA